jgi:hypothetical protein
MVIGPRASGSFAIALLRERRGSGSRKQTGAVERTSQCEEWPVDAHCNRWYIALQRESIPYKPA